MASNLSELNRCITYYTKNPNVLNDLDIEEKDSLLYKIQIMCPKWVEYKHIKDFVLNNFNVPIIEGLKQPILEIPLATTIVNESFNKSIIEIKSQIKYLQSPNIAVVPSTRLLWKEYKKACIYFTKENTKGMFLGMPKVGYNTFASKSHYAIDHKYSMYYGFKHNVPIKDISSLSNLRLVTGYTNQTKGMRIFIDTENSHLKIYIPKGFNKFVTF